MRKKYKSNYLFFFFSFFLAKSQTAIAVAEAITRLEKEEEEQKRNNVIMNEIDNMLGGDIEINNKEIVPAVEEVKIENTENIITEGVITEDELNILNKKGLLEILKENGVIKGLSGKTCAVLKQLIVNKGIKKVFIEKKIKNKKLIKKIKKSKSKQ